MAYGCPVCGEVHADGEHLANHVAVTASLHEGDHLAWLEEHVPDWAERSPGELGEAVLTHAEKRDVDGFSASHDHGRPDTAPSFESALDRQSGTGRARGEETARILREARELTERMERRGSDGDDDGASSGASE